jgi:hypothetical protein
MKKILFIASFLGIVSMASFAIAQESKSNQQPQQKQNAQVVRHISLSPSEGRNNRIQQRQTQLSKAGVLTSKQKNSIRHTEQIKAYQAYKAAH